MRAKGVSMFRLTAIVAGMIVGIACCLTNAVASNTCQRDTGGKCKMGQTAPTANSKTGAVTHKPGEPAARNRLKPRNQYTETEREKIMERAREICRKDFGAPSRVYRIDYATSRIWCEPPSY